MSNDPRPARHQASPRIAVLLGEVAQLYDDAGGRVGARQGFLGIFAIRNVRKMLRQRSAITGRVFRANDEPALLALRYRGDAREHARHRITQRSATPCRRQKTARIRRAAVRYAGSMPRELDGLAAGKRS
jgi:hypothetical protein